MKAFVIFGDIEFFDDDEHTALVHRVQHSGFYGDDELGEVADKYGGDYLVPHHYNGRITFIKLHEDTL